MVGLSVWDIWDIWDSLVSNTVLVWQLDLSLFLLVKEEGREKDLACQISTCSTKIYQLAAVQDFAP